MENDRIKGLSSRSLGGGSPMRTPAFPLCKEALIDVIEQDRLSDYPMAAGDEESRKIILEYLIKEGIDNYFENNIKPIVNKYTTGIIFLNDDNSLCVNGKCQRVQVSLKANINYLFNFEKSMTFTITSLTENNHE